MKVTKYPQSCLVVEQDGVRILVDPGSFVTEQFSANDLLPIDGVIITHEHADHADPELIKALTVSESVPVIANASIKNVLGDLVTKVVADGEEFDIAGLKITAHEIPHVDMMDGSAGPQNTGYIINDEFLVPGDSVDTKGLKVEKLAVPLAGPDISPRDGFDMIKQTGAKVVVPIHYSAFPAKPELIAGRAKEIVPDVQFIVIPEGESAEI